MPEKEINMSMQQMIKHTGKLENMSTNMCGKIV